MAGDPWDAAPCGLLTLTIDGTVQAANREFLAWIGRRADDVVGRLRLSELLSVGGRIYWETHVAPLLHVDGRVDEVALDLRVPQTHTPGGRMPVLLTAVVGDPDHPALVHVAVTSARERLRFERALVLARREAEAAASRLRALQEVSAALSGAVGRQAVADALLDVVVGPLAARGSALWVADADGGLARHDARGTQVPVDVVRAVADRWSAQAPTTSTPASTSLPTPSPPADPTADAPADPTAPTASVTACGPGWVVVTLPGQEVLRGVLAVAPADDQLDAGVLVAVGQQAGLALDRAERHEQRESIAHYLQHSLLAVTQPTDPRVSLAATYRPGMEALEVGGDWYDAFEAEPGVLSVVVGDVVGHGLRSAVAMGQLRSATRALWRPRVSPAEAMEHLDAFVDLVEDAALATLVLARVHLADGRVEYACAGHPPPLLLTSHGEATFLEDGRSTPLGITAGLPSRPYATTALHAGDSLLLYTDGLVERRTRPLDVGLDVLRASAARVAGLPVTEAVRSLTGSLLSDGQGDDDVCVLLVSWAGP